MVHANAMDCSYILHAVCCAVVRSLPNRWEWWLVNVFNGVVMSLVGEYLCMQQELQQSIPVPQTALSEAGGP